MSPRKPKLQKVTLSLLKENLDRDHALRNPNALAGYRIPAIDTARDSLFIQSKPPTPPRWLPYIQSHVSGSLGSLNTASASAVVLFEAEERLFALTFGRGRDLLEPESFEPDFGLKVVLNTVAPNQLKSIDAKTIDESTLHTRSDLSNSSTLSAFGLDVTKDLLRAVTGTPKDKRLAHRLTGSDALGIHTRSSLPEIPGLAKRLLVAYEAEDYKENFDFIDYLRPEKRPGKISELQDLLVEALQTREITDVHLAAPETLDWLDVEGFVFSTYKKGDLESDPRVSTYLDTREEVELDIKLLKRDRLLPISSSSGEAMAGWPIYRCIVYQVELDDHLYVLSAGDWYRVDLSYRKKVEAEVNALPRLEGLPEADAEISEDVYNEKAANAIGGLCLDRKFVFDGGPDKMEVCDILTAAGGLIHVKQRGSSSTLSHLFTQGVNSAERLMLDEEFRRQACAIAQREGPQFPQVLPEAQPDAKDHEISFAVITRSTRNTPLTLPFFSLVSLRTAARQLRAFGFPVSVAAVLQAAS